MKLEIEIPDAVVLDAASKENAVVLYIKFLPGSRVWTQCTSQMSPTWAERLFQAVQEDNVYIKVQGQAENLKQET